MSDTGQVSSQNLLLYRTKSEVACEKEKEIEKEALRNKEEVGGKISTKTAVLAF